MDTLIVILVILGLVGILVVGLALVVGVALTLGDRWTGVSRETGGKTPVGPLPTGKRKPNSEMLTER